MKLADFSKFNRQWDRFMAFHVNLHGGRFVQFETGELMVNRGNWRPHERKFYEDINVSVTSPRDSSFTFALPDGTPCPIAWLIQDGAPFLLVDHDSKKAVSLTGSWNSSTSAARDKLPKHLMGANAWFNAERSEPQSVNKIAISKPYRLSKDERAWLEELTKLCSVFNKAVPYTPDSRWWRPEMLILSQDKFGMSPANMFASMQAETRAGVALRGVNASRVQEEVDYLVVTSL